MHADMPGESDTRSGTRVYTTDKVQAKGNAFEFSFHLSHICLLSRKYVTCRPLKLEVQGSKLGGSTPLSH